MMNALSAMVDTFTGETVRNLEGPHAAFRVDERNRRAGTFAGVNHDVRARGFGLTKRIGKPACAIELS